MPEKTENRILLITGPAGAGRTTSIRILEDFGYEAIDNLPLSLLPRLLNGERIARPLVIGIDTRTHGFATQALLDLVDRFRGEPHHLELVFIDCDEETLLRRFNETRRRHPLAPAESPIIGVRREKELLACLPEVADIHIDTSDLSPHDLKAEMRQLFQTETSQNLVLSVQSFSYKRGTPRGVDTIFDCRFLKNPYWIPELRALNGEDPDVADYVRSDPLFSPFFKQLTNMCDLLLPAYQTEGKAYFAIGLGCSGGQHRSIFVANQLAGYLAVAGWQVSVRHRELERNPSFALRPEGT